MALRNLMEDDLYDLEELIMDNLWDSLLKCLNNGTIGRVLNDLGLYEEAEKMFPDTDRLKTRTDGRIVVFGAEPKVEKNLRGIAKASGIDPSRIEFVTYDRTTNYSFQDLEFAYGCSVILFGCVPHSAKGKGKDGSIISHIESRRDRYPECRRLLCGTQLGISKSNFKETLCNLLDEGLLAAA